MPIVGKVLIRQDGASFNKPHGASKWHKQSAPPAPPPVPLPAANRWVIVIVALVGVAAIGVYSFLGQSVRGATAGIALELAGEKADEGIAAAKGASEKALNAAKAKATLNNYNSNNH